MSPMHPKLRNALLRDPQNRQKGLTAEKLMEYEGLLTRLFHLKYYNNDQSPEIIQPLIKQITDFREDFLPNYADIYQRWLNGQKQALTRHYHDLSVGGKTKLFVGLVLLWLVALLCQKFLLPG